MSLSIPKEWNVTPSDTAIHRHWKQIEIGKPWVVKPGNEVFFWGGGLNSHSEAWLVSHNPCGPQKTLWIWVELSCQVQSVQLGLVGGGGSSACVEVKLADTWAHLHTHVFEWSIAPIHFPSICHCFVLFCIDCYELERYLQMVLRLYSGAHSCSLTLLLPYERCLKIALQ